ncbi:MAG: DNA cytosine methyltransferase, partial [Ruminococcus sp.]|nr:DNA cytosine methyltransferase [Ruminococcus sp.]
MFTLTVTDRHGVIHRGCIRRLMPIECWRLQGFSTEQFRKVVAAGLSDAQLYKQAGNAVTVNVVEAIARNLLEFDKEVWG